MSKTKIAAETALRNRFGNVSVEFVVSISVLFLMSVFPLINLIGVALAAGTMCLMTTQVATTAACQPSYSQALAAAKHEAQSFAQSGFARFLKLKPRSGYQGCGAHLYVLSTSPQGSTQSFGPDTPVPAPLNLNQIYEYSALTTFSAGPLIPLTNVPWASNVPGLGAPMQLAWSTARVAESVYGLTGLASGPPPKRGPITVAMNGAPPGSVFPAWNDSSIYDQIAAAGEVVVSQNVMVVPACTTNWVSSTVQVGPNEHIWTDTQSASFWSFQSSNPNNGGTSAKGVSGFATNTLWSGAQAGCLLAFIGASPPPINPNGYSTQVASNYQSGFVALGDTLSKYTPSTTGPIFLIMNSNATSIPTLSSGQQEVRIVITRAGGGYGGAGGPGGSGGHGGAATAPSTNNLPGKVP